MKTFSDLQDTKQKVKFTLWFKAHEPNFAQVYIEFNDTTSEFIVFNNGYFNGEVEVDKPVKLNIKVLNNIDLEIIEFKIDGREVSPNFEFGTNDWGFDTKEPVYQWLHAADGHGWLLKPNN